MSTFDKIIGYETIKEELMQICDMFQNRGKYDDIGAKPINGILIYGNAGVGKTTLAECFVEECGVNSYIVDKSFDLYKFAENFSDFFEEVRANAPAVVLLDDLDDFTEPIHNILQVEFDSIVDLDVVVIATAKDSDKIPDQLLRAGRFDRRIEMYLPTMQERGQLFEYFLKDKKTDSINYEDLTMMCADCSCADVKSIVNEAAINAAFSGRKEIGMKDLVEVCLKHEYVSPDSCTSASKDDLRKTALHEAGHLVINEILCPDSVGLVSARTEDGFTRRCKDLPRILYEVIVSLGGKAAVELYYAETCASGCQSDIRKAFRKLRLSMNDSGTCGIGMIDVDSFGIGMSESMNARNEAVVHAEMEKCLFKARDILLKNREFLEKATNLLLEKKYLLHSDIKTLKESLTITNVAV